MNKIYKGSAHPVVPDLPPVHTLRMKELSKYKEYNGILLSDPYLIFVRGQDNRWLFHGTAPDFLAAADKREQAIALYGVAQDDAEIFKRVTWTTREVQE